MFCFRLTMPVVMSMRDVTMAALCWFISLCIYCSLFFLVCLFLTACFWRNKDENFLLVGSLVAKSPKGESRRRGESRQCDRSDAPHTSLPVATLLDLVCLVFVLNVLRCESYASHHHIILFWSRISLSGWKLTLYILQKMLLKRQDTGLHGESSRLDI